MSINKLDSQFYADNARLEQFKTRNDENSLSYAAQELESLFLQMLVKSMRDASQAFGSSMSSNHYVGQYQSMYDNQLSNHIAHNGGIGLSQAIQRQLETHVGKSTPQTNMPNFDVSNIKRKAMPMVNQNVSSKQLETFMQFATPREFIDKLTPIVTPAAKELGVSPDLLLAQAALETGWGQHVNESHNLFGIKADSTWQKSGDFIKTKTHEFFNGVKSNVVDKFRSYKNYQESVKDYVAFIKNNPRYGQALKVAENPMQYMQELQKAGYATDPQYAAKVLNIYNRIGANAK